MNLIENYPKKNKGTELHVQKPVQLTTALLKLCIKNYLLCVHSLKVGQWVAANVVFDGYIIPDTATGYETEEDCQEACNAHNTFCGWSQHQVMQIIDQSLKNAHLRN
jgi:hypothetical protein